MRIAFEMKIRRLTICDWQGLNRTDTVVERPSWIVIEAAIRAMNNANLNDVQLELDSQENAFLTIGGGSDNYIVSGDLTGKSFPTLTNPKAAENSSIELMVGGQLGEYPAHCVVDLETALDAVRSVAENGSFDSHFFWIYT